jgi:HTH-type transcriptional regulator, sugar sensing transcriptional regulator
MSTALSTYASSTLQVNSEAHAPQASLRARIFRPSTAPSVSEQEVASLQLLGLTCYEAKTYLTLVRTGSVEGGRLAFHSHVPRSKLYPTLRSLGRKGLVHLIPSTPTIFTAVSPEIALKVKAEEASDQALSALEIVRKLTADYEHGHANGSESGIPREANELWHIDGREQIHRIASKIIKRATKTISYYATQAGLVRAYKTHADCLDEAKRRGVIVRLLAQTNKETRSLARELAAIVNIRQAGRPLDADFICVDGREVIVINDTPGNYDAANGKAKAAWTTNSLLVEAQENLFDTAWENSVTLR